MKDQIFTEAAHAKALFVFAHGAGAGMHHDFMAQVSGLLTQAQISVLRFNFPYMQQMQAEGKSRPPDIVPKLLDYYQQE